MSDQRIISRRTLLKSGAATAAGVTALAALPAVGMAQSASAPAGANGSYTPPPADTTGTLTISNWGDPPDLPVYAAAAERFKAKYPNVTVNDNFVPIVGWTEYINKILADVAAGNAPDVINIAIEGVRQGISKDLFTPMTDWVANDPEGAALVGDVDQRLLDGLSQDGTLYLLPNTWNTMLIYYNTKMFADAGIERPSDDWSWDDFLAVAKQLTTGDGDSKVFGFLLPYFNFGLTPWYYSNGTSQLNQDWTASNLTDPRMTESVTWIRDLVTTHGVAPQPKGLDPYALFPTGKAAMTGAGHWVVGGFKNAGFTDWDIVPWPQKATKATVYGVSGFAVYPGSQNPDLAWEYCKVLGGPETQQGFVAIGGASPALQSVADSPEFLSQAPHSELYYGAIDYALPVAAPIVFSTLDPAMGRALDAVLAGTDPAEALATANDEVTQAFADAAAS
jgi:multiple sugar transport system substrate-binding protein